MLCFSLWAVVWNQRWSVFLWCFQMWRSWARSVRGSRCPPCTGYTCGRSYWVRTWTFIRRRLLMLSLGMTLVSWRLRRYPAAPQRFSRPGVSVSYPAVWGHQWRSDGHAVRPCVHSSDGALPPHVPAGEPAASPQERAQTAGEDDSVGLWVIHCVFSCLRFVMVFLQDDEDLIFLAIARAMEEIVDDPVDCYWLVRCFVIQFQHKFGDSIPHLVHVDLLKEQFT